MPQGLAWNKTEGSNLSNLVTGESKEFARVDAAAEKTLREICPWTTTELIEEWAQMVLGDDDCVNRLNTPEEKRLAVIAKLQAVGGSDATYFQNIAKAAGFLIAVSDGFQQFRVGSSRMGDRLLADGFAYTWEVRSPSETLRYFRMGSGRMGDPLVYFGNSLLECIIRSIKPAHTEVIFRYQDVIQYLAGDSSINISMSGGPTVTRFCSGNSSINLSTELGDSWTPEQLQNLLLWFDAEEFSSDVAISTWTDKIGNRDAEQADLGSQPASITDAINGRSIIRFGAGDKLEVKALEQFNANNGLHFFTVCDIASGGGLLFDRKQINFTVDSTLSKLKALTTTYRANLGNPTGLGVSGGSAGVAVFQGDVYVTSGSFGMFRLNNDGTWTDVLSAISGAPRGPMIVVGTKLYAVSSTVNKMYVWDGTTGYEYPNTVNATADLKDLVYNPGDGLIYVAAEKNGAGTQGKLLTFNPATNVWAEVGAGVDGCTCVATDGTNVYINKRAAGAGDIYKWNGSTFTSEGLSGFSNPLALTWAQNTLWMYDSTTGKVTNKANSYTATNVPSFLYLNAQRMLEVDGQLWMISDGTYFGGAIARLILDGTNLSTASWVLDDYGGPSLIQFGGNNGDYVHTMAFIPGTDNLEVYANGGSNFYRIERIRYVQDTNAVPDQSIVYFGIDNKSLKISINGQLVQNVTFNTETYQNPKTLLEQIAITNTSLVTFLDNVVTINPTSDLPENAVIEVVIDPDAVTDWSGIDDWRFETGASA